MKLTLFSALAGSAAAFAPAQTSTTSTTALNAEKEMSKALPFLPRPKLLDGSLPGDVGFDPFNLGGGDKASLINMREAEIKHGRLAELSSKETKEEKGKAYIAGDCGFDPLGLFPQDKEGMMAMQTKEIKHSRIAMMAVLGYAAQEALFRSPVTEETPMFFKSVLFLPQEDEEAS
eukprot:scaffold1236_cov138-Skeletonema_marinoi.AAC.4